MPKPPDDDIKLRGGDAGPSPLSTGLGTLSAPSDAPRPYSYALPEAARAPAPRRKGPGGLIFVSLLLVASIAGAVWYFVFR